MNIKRKWDIMFMFEIAVFVLVISGTAQVASAYDYYMDRAWSYYYDVSGLDYGQGWHSNGTGFSSAIEPEYGVADCNTWARAKTLVQGCETDAYAYSVAGYWIDWSWTGPPGEAPGGTFTWEFHAEGCSIVDGYNRFGVPTDTAYAESYGTSATGADAQAEDDYLFCDLWGWALNKTTSDCDCSIDVQPIGSITVPTYDLYNDYRSYTGLVEWEFDNGDEVAIAAGTTYVLFDSGCLSESASEVISTGTGTAYAYTYNQAHLFVEQTDFDYIP